MLLIDLDNAGDWISNMVIHRAILPAHSLYTLTAHIPVIITISPSLAIATSNLTAHTRVFLALTRYVQFAMKELTPPGHNIRSAVWLSAVAQQNPARGRRARVVVDSGVLGLGDVFVPFR